MFDITGVSGILLCNSWYVASLAQNCGVEYVRTYVRRVLLAAPRQVLRTLVAMAYLKKSRHQRRKVLEKSIAVEGDTHPSWNSSRDGRDELKRKEIPKQQHLFVLYRTLMYVQFRTHDFVSESVNFLNIRPTSMSYYKY